MDIAALVTTVTGSIELGRLLVKERDSQKAALIESQLTEKLTQVQIQLSQVLGAVIEKDGLIQALSERVRTLEADQRERARYRLSKVGSVGDFHAYALRSSTELEEHADEPSHYLCQPCLDIRKHKSILRITSGTANCDACKRYVRIEPSPNTPAPRRQRVQLPRWDL
ncbi:hypothetical protein [Delftia sp. PS-11]|uniref:hypothetical protein n=1 Tax=Delftia sp. PS-11 TaxID=2767222 RepID=UPI002457F932|nr:hypothetical protein [Delftia sp. PS-11]KAJ8744588.1 hypothetical protein H9T68_11595 [Delftia sp. PS-11]